MSKIKYRGKVYIEYKEPVLKSWMMGLFTGAISMLLFNSLKGWWNIISFLVMFLLISITQIMYEKELKSLKEGKE